MIPTGGVSQLSGCCPPYGYHFSSALGFLFVLIDNAYTIE